MMSYQLLEQSEEDKLHKTRLLNVEEKPFKRITKRIFTPGSLISKPTQLPLTPPPTGADDDQTTPQEALQHKQLEERRQFREDVLLDFAAFDSGIARIQMLHNSNKEEREQYRMKKDRIVNEAQAVKDNTAELRVQLEAAKRTMEQRKKFDDLAEKITNNRLLRPREDQEVNLKKLEEECRELEKESLTYSATWKERREQFGRIVEEGMQLRRLIRDEKEEVERREGMDGGEEDGEVGETGSRGGQTPKHSSQSGGATPRPENAATPRADGGATPRDLSPARTPAHGEDTQEGLKPRPLRAGTLSRSGSRVGSRNTSPAPSERKLDEDVSMENTWTAVKEADSPVAEVASTPDVSEPPAVMINEPDVEMAGTPATEDQMDTS